MIADPPPTPQVWDRGWCCGLPPGGANPKQTTTAVIGGLMCHMETDLVKVFWTSPAPEWGDDPHSLSILQIYQ